MSGKSVLLSKVLWLNVMAVLVAISESTEFTNVIPAGYMPMFTALIAVVNVILRTMTMQPVEMRMPKRVATAAPRKGNMHGRTGFTSKWV